MVKLADARDSKSRDRKVVRVRPPPPAPISTKLQQWWTVPTRIDALIKMVLVSIEKLREYRTALISAMVTGKIDVRGKAK